jgi:Ca2+-binding EF-hand superfamily protein
MLIMRFGGGNLYVTFEQFCMMMEFLKEQKRVFLSYDLTGNGKLSADELHAAFAKSGLNLSREAVVQIGHQYDKDASGFIEFDEFLQMMIEWTEVSSSEGSFTKFQEQRCSPTDLQVALGGIRVFYSCVNGYITNLQRPFSLSTCRTLVAMFGTPLVGEVFPSGLTYQECMACISHVKMCASKFSQCDLDQGGSISADELQVALSKSGISVNQQTVLQIIACYDYDRSGRIEFDEFLQMLLDAQMIARKMDSMNVQDQQAVYQIIYSMPRGLFR